MVAEALGDIGGVDLLVDLARFLVSPNPDHSHGR